MAYIKINTKTQISTIKITLMRIMWSSNIKIRIIKGPNKTIKIRRAEVRKTVPSQTSDVGKKTRSVLAHFFFPVIKS